VQKIFVNGHF